MAQLAFGIAGGVVGGMFGMPQLGFVVGSVLGQVLFPTKQKGPQIGDLSVQSSAYGYPIPIGFGTFRMAGNVIWAERINAKANDAGLLGKGGLMGGTPKPPYTYYGSFAVAFAEGPAAAVLRIWADKKLVYDGRPGTTQNSIGTFRFYPGDDEQLPDVLIESNVGAGFCPAYRGLVYIVFDNIDLTNYGNRLPSIEAEIAFAGGPVVSTRFSSEISTADGGIFTGASPTFSLAVDRKRRRVYAVGSGGTASQGIRVFNMDTLVETQQAATADIFTDSQSTLGNVNSAFTVGDSGFIATGTGVSNYAPVALINPNSMTEVGKIGIFSTFGSGTWPPAPAASQFLAEATALDSAGSRRHFVASIGVLGSLWVGDVENLVSVWEEDASAFSKLHAVVPVVPPAMGTAAWWLFDQVDNNTANNPLLIHRLEVDTDYRVEGSLTIGVRRTLVATITADVWNNDGAATVATGPMIDQRDGGLIFLIPAASGGTYVLKWTIDQGVVWVTKVTTGVPQFHMETSGPVNSTITQSRFGWVQNNFAVLIDTTTGAVILDGEDIGGSAAFNVSDQFYDGDTQSVIAIDADKINGHVLTQVFLGRDTGSAVSLQSIVEDISNRVNLVPGTDINATELANIDVQGYAVTAHMAAADAISPLSQAFFFDGVESDGVIYFKLRARDPIRTIKKSDMMYVDDSGQSDDVVRETIVQEIELPQFISLNFIDYSLDYQADSMSATRVGDPINAGTVARNRRSFSKFRVPKGSVKSHDKQIVSIPIVMVPSQAAQTVEEMLFTTWNERMTETFRLDPSQADLDPGDVITIDLENGTLITTRIVKAVLNADFSLSVDALKMNKYTLSSTRTALGGQGQPQLIPPDGGATLLFLFDIPLLRDIDDMGGRASRLYLAMNGYTSRWVGGTLWQSGDNATYNDTGVRITRGVTYGTVINALPATDSPFQTDTTTQLRVVLMSGALASVGSLDFLNDANVAIIGDPVKQNWEVVDFQNAVQQPDGSYLVSVLMRGRRGTEVNCNSHSNGEYFVVPAPNTLASYYLSLGNLKTAAYYRGVGFSQLVEDADTEALTSQGGDLKPYAPCHLDATTDGSSISFSWVRRTRFGGQLQDGVGDVPLNEATESYEIDIYQNLLYRGQLGDSAVHQYRLNEASGTVATDGGSSPSNGTYTGGVTLVSPAITPDNARSAAFDGSTGYADLGFTDPPQGAGGAFSVECVFKVAALSGNPRLLANDHSDQNGKGFQLYLNPKSVTFGVGKSQVTDAAQVAAGQTVHALGVCDGANLYLYVNGVLVASGPLGAAYVPATSHTNIGRNPSYNGDFFDGAVSDVAFYDYALTAEQAAQHYQESIGQGGKVVRTLTSSTPSVSYLNADIVTDFGAVPSSIIFAVYQISAAVGRGFGSTAAITF